LKVGKKSLGAIGAVLLLALSMADAGEVGGFADKIQSTEWWGSLFVRVIPFGMICLAILKLDGTVNRSEVRSD
jgi:hypothetical protein